MRQTWRAGRPRRRRIGLVEVVGAGMLLASVGIAALLESRGTRDEGAEALIEYADQGGMEPVSLISAVAQAHRLVLLGDLPGAAEPKRIAADAIESLANGPGLDAVVLEVGSDLQGVIDRYLESDPEDATGLFSGIPALQQPTAAAAAHMDVFRRIWQLNQQLAPTQRIRIIAADLPGWPPERTTSPHSAAALYAERDEHMYDVVSREILDRDPNGRVLFFLSNPHLLKSAPAEVQVGEGTRTPVRWLGARLHEQYPAEVYSVLVDDGRRTIRADSRSSRAATRAFEVFRSDATTASGVFAVRVDQRFDFLASPVYGASLPGLRLQLLPPGELLRDAVDAYVYLGSGERTQRQP